jgi:putative spermidine/putrescine transport system ATP-binding protein
MSADGRPVLELDGLDVHYGVRRRRRRALHAVSLSVQRGEALGLIGETGSGKSTLARAVLGLVQPSAGRIVVDGEDVTRLPPDRRRFGMVFQHYALFPHLTVGGNVAFGLAGRGLDKAAVERRVAESLALVELPGFQDRRVGQISGGQQQRVALARALAPEPRVLLLDEPLSNLDPTLRERTRRELKAAIRRVGITTLLVTHEQEEAFHLGDRVAVLYRGILQQVGRPEDLYARPATRFVATFVGRASVLPGRFEREGAVRLDAPGNPAWPGEIVEGSAPPAPGEAVDLIVRPESLAFRALGDPAALAGQVIERRYAGPVTYYQVTLAGGLEIEVLAPSGAAAEGDAVALAPIAPLAPGAVSEIAPRIFRRTEGAA